MTYKRPTEYFDEELAGLLGKKIKSVYEDLTIYLLFSKWLLVVTAKA
ncbi:hypothetical protein Asal01_01303 [Fodinibius salicampi]